MPREQRVNTGFTRSVAVICIEKAQSDPLLYFRSRSDSLPAISISHFCNDRFNCRYGGNRFLQRKYVTRDSMIDGNIEIDFTRTKFFKSETVDSILHYDLVIAESATWFEQKYETGTIRVEWWLTWYEIQDGRNDIYETNKNKIWKMVWLVEECLPLWWNTCFFRLRQWAETAAPPKSRDHNDHYSHHRSK